MVAVLHPFSSERVRNAVQKVHDRRNRAASAFESAGIRYAIVGGNAVADWVARADEAAVRNTRDVVVLIDRADLESAKQAMTVAGFVFRHVRGVDMFLDGPGAKVRDAVHVIYAGEKVMPEHTLPAPTLDQTVEADGFRVVDLESLVQMKLVFYRDKDRTHLRDMIDVELIDQTWPARFPAPLDARLQALLDDPDG